MNTPDRGDLIVYRTEDGQAEVQLQTLDGSVWLNLGEMAKLFDTTKQNVSLHIKNILKEGELPEAATVKDAWIDHCKTKVGYEIPLNRHFYRYEPPRELAEIKAEIKGLEGEILDLLREVTV